MGEERVNFGKEVEMESELESLEEQLELTVDDGELEEEVETELDEISNDNEEEGQEEKLDEADGQGNSDKLETAAFEAQDEKNESKTKTTEWQDIGKEEEKLEEFDTSQFEALSIKSSTRSIGKAGVLSIINSEKNGKRVTLAKEVKNEIGNPPAVMISINKDKIAISPALLNSPNSLKLGKTGAKGVIYSSELVEILTEKYNLDFTERVSITFDKVEYKLDRDKIIAIVTMM